LSELDGFKPSSSLRSVGSWNYKLRDMAPASLSDPHFGVVPGVLHVSIVR